MLRLFLRSLCLAIGAVAVMSTPTSGQDIMVDGDYYLIQFDEVEGETLVDFIHLAKTILQQPIEYNPTDTDIPIRIIGPQRVKQDQFYQYFQAVLKSVDFLVVPFGAEGSGRFLKIQKLSGGGTPARTIGVRAQAPVVNIADLEKYKNDVATLVTTSLPLHYVAARDVMTTFQQLTDTTIEAVRHVENSNSLVITGFGQHVWGMVQLSRLIDVPPFKPQPVIRKRKLVHASVDEIVEVINEMLSAARGLRAGQAQPANQLSAMTAKEIEPRIIAEGRSNSLIIAADEEMLARIESWIDILDTEVEPRGNTHVYRLKNSNADQIAAVLQQVLQEQEQATQQARQGAASITGGSSSLQGGLELRASAVPDPTSNSLIITASDRKYAEIIEIIRELDVRPRQVLIECAIVETTQTLNDTFKAGLALGDIDDGALVSNFGTPITFEDAAGVVDINNALTSNGGQFGIFSGADIGIPFVLEMLQSDISSRVLSRPYLLTNDNQEATLVSENEQSYETVSTTNSTVQSNFEQVTAGITLIVSPTISAGNYLKLNVEVEVSSFAPAAGTSSTGASPPPDKSTRLVNTPVTIPDGHTVVLGGLISEDNQTTEKKTPWLADLPGIGWMFRSNEDTNQNTYLYIFITPHIIDSDFALLDEITDLRKREAIRLSGDIPLPLSMDLNNPGDAEAAQEISEALETVFSIPTPAFPPTGEMGGDTPHVETTPANTPPLPAPESEVPSFDEIFGVDTDN